MAARRLTSVAHCVCYMFAAVAIAELLLLNVIILYIYSAVRSDIQEFNSPHSNALLDKLLNSKKVSSLVDQAKDGGFIALIHETLERLYIVHERKSNLTDMKGKSTKEISTLGLDVSHSGEAIYIYSRILSKSKFPYQFLVVDIGANDGLLSSNSFNFIQWGWDAVLVEPQADELMLARKNVQRYVDQYADGDQQVHFLQAVIGDRDGSVEFVLTRASQGMESKIKTDTYQPQAGDQVISVQSLTVQSFAKRYEIPKKFGILSIDAEGYGSKILHQFIQQGFRPAYILHERIHRTESIQSTSNLLEKAGYHYIGQRGWNIIFEHQD